MDNSQETGLWINLNCDNVLTTQTLKSLGHEPDCGSLWVMMTMAMAPSWMALS